MSKNQYDFVVIGAGIVGITIARELKLRNPSQKILILEKERSLGMHSSGRNSGVLHSGIYYPADSVKAKVCRQGSIEMAAYHRKNNLPLLNLGKILIAANEADVSQFDILAERAEKNGVEIEVLDQDDLRKLEPEAQSASGKALFVPSTAVGSPQAVLDKLSVEIDKMGIELMKGALVVDVLLDQKQLKLADGSRIKYGHVVNAAGLYADKVAHLFEVGRRYTLLPFKGIYWKLDPRSGIKINHLIYPVPDLNVPFLGIHTTTAATDGSTYLGPTAVPAFGRENYRGFGGVRLTEFLRISGLLSTQFIKGVDGFRNLAFQEGRRYFKPFFTRAAQAVIPNLKQEHLLPTEKVGIRAQMLDLESGRLVTDFLVESGSSSTHILNAISPAWTSAFPFARYICNQFIERRP